jgi:hypothetical protein
MWRQSGDSIRQTELVLGVVIAAAAAAAAAVCRKTCGGFVAVPDAREAANVLVIGVTTETSLDHNAAVLELVLARRRCTERHAGKLTPS